MGELVEAPLDAEVGAEGEREHARVGREVAARVVADQQHRALLGDAVEAAHLGAEVEAGEHPQPRQRLADVVGVALVEVGGGHAPLGLLGDRGEGARREARARDAHAGPDPRRGTVRPPSPAPRAAPVAARASSRAALPGRRILCGSPCGRSAQQVARLAAGAAARAPCAVGGLDHLLAPARAHQVAAHRLAVLGGRLDQQHLGAEAAHLARLVGEPPAVGLAAERAEPVARVERAEAQRAARVVRRQLGARRERVEADDEVEAAAGEQVEVRGRAHAAVDVAAAPDPDRPVEAGDRAGGGDGVGDLGVRGVEPAERDAAAALVVAGDGPVVGVVDPALRDGAPDQVPRASRSRRRPPAASRPPSGAACGRAGWRAR